VGVLAFGRTIKKCKEVIVSKIKMAGRRGRVKCSCSDLVPTLNGDFMGITLSVCLN
jgi:hypothetical protein